MQTRNKVCESQVKIPMLNEVIVSVSATIDDQEIHGAVTRNGNSVATIKYDYAGAHEFLQVTMKKFFEEIDEIGPTRFDELPMHHTELKSKWGATLGLIKPKVACFPCFLDLFNVRYYVHIEMSNSGYVVPGFINLNLRVDAMPAKLSEECPVPTEWLDECPIPVPQVLSVDVRDNKAVIRLNLDF